MKAEDWAAHYGNEHGRRRWPNEELVRFAGRRGNVLGDMVLEVGCGDGANLAFLREYATTVVGMDWSSEALGLAGKICEGDTYDRIALAKGDARDLSQFETGAFSGVVDCMVTQHAPWHDHLAAYQGYRRVLMTGGWFWLFHLDNHTASRRGGNLGSCDWSGLALFPAVKFFCLPHPGALELVCEQAGFKVLSRYGLQREYPTCETAHYTVLEMEAK